MIPGLDEGLHTMKVGGTRRILIPPKLGFIDIGLGPLPDMPWNRYRLNQLLDQMMELSGGTVIYEVTLLSVIPDEADLGYYTDASLSPEDFATLRENLRVKGNAGRIQEQAAAAAATTTIQGQDRVR
jgi:FKBP-type peptidyl-prolyl cis-trans isomerase